MFRVVLMTVVIVSLTGLCDWSVSANRVYIRHKRDIERENDTTSVPRKESTVVVQGDNATEAVRDIENEIVSHEKDCKDFFEFDYNPLNDSLLFSGKIPTFSHNNHLSSFEELLHRMLQHTSSMFKDFPTMPNNNYPDNYNGTVEEEVTIDGKRFMKKQHIVNKSTHGSKISIMSTIYEPIDDDTPSGATGNSTMTNTVNSDTNGTTVRPDLTDGKIISY